MAGAPAVPELQNDATAVRVNGISDAAPPGDLRRVVDAGLGTAEGRVALDHHGCLANAQAGGGALGVILGHQRTGQMAGLGAAPGERRHHNA